MHKIFNDSIDQNSLLSINIITIEISKFMIQIKIHEQKSGVNI